jgi:hypothetical protein
MKTRMIIGLVALAVASAAITFGQWAVVMGGDDFVITDFGKAFIYGFPFRIVDAAPDSPLGTPSWQIPFRFLGNFTVFFFAGLFTLWLIRRIRDRTHHHEDRVTHNVA